MKTRDEIRTDARSLRERVESGEKFSLDEVLANCLSLDEALLVFQGRRETADKLVPVCCGAEVACHSGLMANEARCEKCGAAIVDVLAPFSSPILERGNSYVSVPSDDLIERVGDRSWLVTHEGSKP